MRPNPLYDAVQFLTKPGWFTPVFWLLLLASVVVAILVWRQQPEQRTVRYLGVWGLRVLMGSMWWQQTLWKIPPNFGGLQYWMQQEADHAAIALQGALVRDVVLPNLGVFGPLVYLVELLIGVSLLPSRARVVMCSLCPTTPAVDRQAEGVNRKEARLDRSMARPGHSQVHAQAGCRSQDRVSTWPGSG